MYFKKFLLILIFSFMIGIIVSYFNRINGTIIIYPKLRNNIIYKDDNNKTYIYKIKKV